MCMHMWRFVCGVSAAGRGVRLPEKPQCEERTPGRPLQPLLQHAAAVQQAPKEQQPEQQTEKSCSTGTRRISK